MYSFEEVDVDGLSALQSEEFIERDGMLFRKNAFDRSKVEEHLAQGVARSTIQIQMNHVSLISYGGAVDKQWRHAQEVTAAWLKRIEQDFPNLYPWIITEVSPAEVILSVRVVSRSGV